MTEQPIIIRRNFETDFVYIERFGKINADGVFQPTTIPDNRVDFEVELWADDGIAFKASRLAGVYNYCEQLDDSRLKIYVPLSSHPLGVGHLRRKLRLRTPAAFYNKEDEKICVPKYTGIALWDGPSDDCAMTPQIEEMLGGVIKGRDGIAAFYHIHTKKIHTYIPNTPPATGIHLKSHFEFATVIEGVTNDQLAAMAAAPDTYRLVLMTNRKHDGEGRRWRVPMWPYETAKRLGKVGGRGTQILETDTWWPVIGRITPWMRNGRIVDQAISLNFTKPAPTPDYRFCATRSIKRRVGVALFKKTGGGGEGWSRISNIAYVTFFVQGRNTITPSIGVTVDF